MTSEIRTNTLKNRVGLGTISFTNTGAIVSGIVTANSFSGPISGTTGTFSGNVDINGDIDVDGHANLDDVNITGDLAISDTIKHIGDNNTKIRFPANDTFTVELGGSERVRFGSSGEYDDISGSSDAGIIIGSGSFASAGIQIRTSATGTGRIYFGDNSGNDNGRKDGSIVYGQSSRSMQFATAQTERLRIDSGGRALINRTNNDAPGGYASKLQIRDTTYTASISVVRNDPGGGGPALVFGKSRNAAQSDATLVQSGDTLGQIDFYGADGTDMNSAGANITAQVDGTPGGNDMPGRLIFKTTADAATSPTERLRITSTGYVQTKSELWVGGSAPVLRWRDSTHGEKATARIDGNDLYFEVANSARLRITSTGDVNIGGSYTQTDSRVHIQDVTRPFQEGTLTLSSATTTNGAADNGATLRFQGHDGVTNRYQASIRGAKENGTSGDYAGYLTLNTRPNGGGMVERLRIESDGQVVINRSSGAILTDSSSKLEVYNATENHIFVANSTAAASQDAGIIFAPANNVYGGKIIVTSDEDFSSSANRTAHMAFYTRKDGTAAERLRIDSSGRVTTPGQCGFSAYSTATFSHGSSTGVIDVTTVSNELFDTGGDYNASTNEFTAPVTGKYFFSFTYSYRCTSGYLVIRLGLNTGSGYASYGRFSAYVPQQSSFSKNGQAIMGVMPLSAGHKVRPQVEVNYAGNQLQNIQYSGYLLG